jgi:hypothetical protein
MYCKQLTNFFKYLLLLGIVLPAVAQQSILETNPTPATLAENRFFELDFTNAAIQQEELEKRFFTTFPHDDPTGGEVVYDRTQWENEGIVSLKPGDGLYLFVKARSDSQGYDSFRLTSKNYYNLNDDTPGILFVFKGQFPSAKGVWPAWWLNGSKEASWQYQHATTIPTDADLDTYSGKGPFYSVSSPVNGIDWPSAGEIDIIETINGDNIIHNTVHTCPGMCDAVWNSSDEVINCANATDGDPNAGCSGKPYYLQKPEGTFACIWEPYRLRFYYWPPEADVRAHGGPLSQTPDPQLWENDNMKNEVVFLDAKIPCEPSRHQQWQCDNCRESEKCNFVNLKMIFNTTICGKWAGAQFDQSEQSEANCKAYILGEGKPFINNQYFKIEYVAVKKLSESN